MRYRKLKAPISVQVEITEACNNSCLHCYNHWRENNNNACKTLVKEDLLFIVDRIIENKIFSVTLTGGEPLLAWDILPYAIQRFSSNKVQVSLNSNATLFNDEMAKTLKKSGLNSVLVSLFSNDENTHDEMSGHCGAFRRTVEGIRTAVSNGFKVDVNMVLLRKNFDRIYETAKFLKGLGIKSFSVTKASPALNNRNFDDLRPTREQVKESLRLLEKIKLSLDLKVDILECYPLCLIGNIEKYSYFARRSCSAGITTCTISPIGEVRPCSHSDMVYGNIFKEDFSDIWDKMSDWRESKYVPIECKKCKFVYLCSGGCRMEARYLGDICGKDLYMTKSEDVIIGEKKQIISSEIVINPQNRYKLNEGFRFREEDFGAIVKTAKSETVLINKDGYELLKTISVLNSFSIQEICERTGIQYDKLTRFVELLIKKQMIVIANHI